MTSASNFTNLDGYSVITPNEAVDLNESGINKVMWIFGSGRQAVGRSCWSFLAWVLVFRRRCR